MKSLFSIIVTLCSFSAFASDVISCGDAIMVGGEAKSTLHSKAQRRAQEEIEAFVEKKLTKPFVDALGRKSDPETMAKLIEVFWCEVDKTPLHSAYYRFYSRNKYVFD